MMVQLHSNALDSRNLRRDLKQNAAVARSEVEEGVAALDVHFADQASDEVWFEALRAEILAAGLAVGFSSHFAGSNGVVQKRLECNADARGRRRTVRTARLVVLIVFFVVVKSSQRIRLAERKLRCSKTKFSVRMTSVKDVGRVDCDSLFDELALLKGEILEEDGGFFSCWLLFKREGEIIRAAGVVVVVISERKWRRSWTRIV